MYFVLLIILFMLLYKYGTRSHKYWEKKGVKHEKPIPFLGNNAKRYLLQKSITQIAADVYFRYPNDRFIGFYRGNAPEIVVRDPDLIKQFLITDFMHFHSRGVIDTSVGEVEPLLRNLFFADGDLWRLLRQRMTPAFTSGKLKAMFPLIVERAEILQARLEDAVTDGRAIDARDIMARYTTDFIGACGFGLDADSLNDDNSAFRDLGARIFETNFSRAFTTIFKSLFPKIFQHLKFLGQELEDDILALVNSIQKDRGYKPSGRNDFIDLLMEIRKKGKIVVDSLERFKPDGTPERTEMELSEILLGAQAFIFFAAGFETSSSATSFTLHQLAYHQDVQRKAQEDIDRVLEKYDNKLSYDAIKEMTYVEWTLKEGMRMFPSSGFLMRRCVKEYTIPGTDITIDPKVRVVIPLQAIHNDPQYFDNPTEFRPERFSPEESAKRHNCVYLPFGGGPRACVGERMGLMQSMAGLAAVLSKFSVSPAPNTRRELISDPKTTIVQNITGGLPLSFHIRK